MADPPHEMTPRHALLNEARALRLVSALLQGHEHPGGSLQSWHLALEEIDCYECLQETMVVLATALAEQLAPPGCSKEQADGAMAELDLKIKHLQELAAKQED